MGIPGLLKGLQCVACKGSVADYRDKALAVDASSWFHKSVYSIAELYVESTYHDKARIDPKCLQASTKYVEARCNELLHGFRIRHIYLVLDGKRCTLKAVTNKAREKRRQENLAQARQFKEQGQHHEAEEKYKACIKVNDALANAVASAVERKIGAVTCVRSPYEADAQLAKLCIDGLADAVVTEDSDVLVYSASCRIPFPILFKLDRHSGYCDIMDMNWLIDPSSKVAQSLVAKKESSKKRNVWMSILKSLISRESRRSGLGIRLFVQACVLTGCDYAPSQLNGVGLVTAFKLVREHAHRPCGERFLSVLKSLAHKNMLVPSESQELGHGSVLEQYEELLSKSEAVFYHHAVWQESKRAVVPLVGIQAGNDYKPSLERFSPDYSFLGAVSQRQESTGKTQFDQERHTEEESRFPVPEIVVVKKNASLHGRNHKRSHSRQKNSCKPSSLNVNPYRKRSRSKKRPLSAIDANRELEGHGNQFAAFQYSDDEAESKQPPTKSKSNLSMYRSTKQDVRFVRPTFSSEGRKKPNLQALKRVAKGGASKPDVKLPDEYDFSAMLLQRCQSDTERGDFQTDTNGNSSSHPPEISRFTRGLSSTSLAPSKIVDENIYNKTQNNTNCSPYFQKESESTCFDYNDDSAVGSIDCERIEGEPKDMFGHDDLIQDKTALSSSSICEQFAWSEALSLERPGHDESHRRRTSTHSKPQPYNENDFDQLFWSPHRAVQKQRQDEASLNNRQSRHPAGFNAFHKTSLKETPIIVGYDDGSRDCFSNRGSFRPQSDVEYNQEDFKACDGNGVKHYSHGIDFPANHHPSHPDDPLLQTEENEFSFSDKVSSAPIVVSESSENTESDGFMLEEQYECEVNPQTQINYVASKKCRRVTRSPIQQHATWSNHNISNSIDESDTFFDFHQSSTDSNSLVPFQSSTSFPVRAQLNAGKLESCNRDAGGNTTPCRDHDREPSLRWSPSSDVGPPVESHHFTTPFQASQATSLRSLHTERKERSPSGPLDTWFRKSSSNRQDSSGIGKFKRGNNRRAKNANSGIRKFFKPIVTIKDLDDDLF